MKKVWIIVANGSQSTIYKAENLEHLTPLKHFNHKESHQRREDLVSDRPGRMTQKGVYSTDSLQEKTSPKLKEFLHFAQELAHFLEEGLKTGEYDHLYIIAKPPFLGHLRDYLSPHVLHLVQTEIHKDLTLMKPEEIREYLPPIL